MTANKSSRDKSLAGGLINADRAGGNNSRAGWSKTSFSFLLNNPIICSGSGYKKMIYVLNPPVDNVEFQIKVNKRMLAG